MGMRQSIANYLLKGFTVSRQPGQELERAIGLMPRTNFDYGAQVNGRQSAIIMACVKWVQRTFPEAPLMLKRLDKDGEWSGIPTHPLLSLMETPNEYYDGLLLQAATITDLVLDGNAYWWKIRSASSRVVALLWVPSTLIEPHWPRWSDDVFIESYKYTTGHKVQYIPIEDIVHFRDGFDPRNIRKGLSPLQSLFREIFTDDEASNTTAALLKNLGIVGLVISPADGTVSPAEAEATKEWFKDNFSRDKKGEPLVMSGATKIDQFGTNLKDMDLRSLRRIPEERISAVLGVPAIVAGLGAGLDRSTFANYKEAREAAYESNIIPTQRLVGSAIKRQLLSDFEDNLEQWRVGYDLSEVRVLQEDEKALSDRTVSQVTGGVLKINDSQRILGLPVDEGADYYLRPFNVMPAYSGNGGLVVEEIPPRQPPKQLKAPLDEARLEIHWKSYAMKAEHYENLLVPKLRAIFSNQRKEAMANLRDGKQDHFINLAKAEQDYIKAAEPILEDQILKAVDDARNLVRPRNPRKADPAIEGIANQNSINWLKTRMGWVAQEFGEETERLLANSLATGFAEGESIPKLTNRVKDTFEFCSKVRAKRIARTETIQAAAQGAIEGYKEVGVRRLQFYAALDERTCDECMDLHNNEFPIEESTGIITVHPGCRCVWVPIVESM